MKHHSAMLKVELHSHTADDPCDRIPYSTKDLIDRAATLGYDALAITLHEKQLDLRPHEEYAAERGLVLIPGIERTVEGKHVLLLNFSRAAEDVGSFNDLGRLKARESGIVIAPHAFFPSGTCLWGLLDRYADLFDAVEVNGMFTRWLDFNERARRWASAHGKPLVGNGDVHRLSQLGTTYSLVEADPNPASICDAIAAGRVEISATPHTSVAAARLAAELFAPSLYPLVGSHRPAQATT
jgi:predicted metal-dependent phosphoesterase TrpH